VSGPTRQELEGAKEAKDAKREPQLTLEPPQPERTIAAPRTNEADAADSFFTPIGVIFNSRAVERSDTPG